jgi:hypothetical protein
MITRDELRTRMSKLGIGPTLLAAYAGVYSQDVSYFLSGREDGIPELAEYRIEDALVGCEKLQAEVGVPIRWTDVVTVKPRLAEHMQTLSQRRLAETNKAELRQMHSV